jgi:hypothetical protein
MSRGCNEVSRRSTYVNLIRGSLQAGVECLYIIPVYFGIYDGGYKPIDVESGLDKIRVVP